MEKIRSIANRVFICVLEMHSVAFSIIYIFWRYFPVRKYKIWLDHYSNVKFKETSLRCNAYPR